MKKLLNPFGMLVCGLVIGTAARLMDIYCENLGENFFADVGVDTLRHAHRNLQPD